MTFSYSDYHFHCMVIPLITLFLTGAIFAGGAYKAVKDIARKGATVEKVLTLLMCLLIGGFFIRLDGGRLLNGGLYMLQEKPADAISHRGVIEKIVPCDQCHFPNISKYHKEYSNVNNTSIYGYEIAVDNMDFKAPEIGTLTQGDAVVICFLPKSGYILSVEKETPEN